MDKLIPAFETTLFDPTLSGMCTEMAELGIDSLLDEGIFKSVPVVGLLVGVAKTAQNIHDRNLLIQTVKFINTFNSKRLSESQKKKYKEHLDADPRFAEEELGRVLILLNSNVDVKKSELLAKFYHAYVEEKVTWELFCELSEVIMRVFITDIELLYAIYNKEVSDTTQCEAYRAERLIALGLLDSAVKSVMIGNQRGNQTHRYLQTNTFGDIFCELGK